MVLYSLYYTTKGTNEDYIIRSDARGYYAYLPALFIYNDGSFGRSSEAERAQYDQPVDQLYLFKDQNGKHYNKYFPGIALLQVPFFALACVVSWIAGAPVDGYSGIFMACYYIGSLFYMLAGLLLFAKCLRALFPEQYNRVRWIVPVVYIASPLLFYTVITPGFSHLYSFFLFGLFTLQILKFRSGEWTGKTVLFTGIILGMIVLVRPTNITVVLMIPFLLGTKAITLAFFRALFQNRLSQLLKGAAGFLLVFSLLFCSWKWQTGSWIVWSYSGEGFNFLHPQLVACLFSFRTGLFLHAPALLLSLAGIVLLFRENSFRAGYWLLYFALNVWIISSWWCWDYESPFGNRPYSEHMFFLLLPLAFLLQSRLRKLSIFLFSGVVLLGIIRFGEITTGYFGDQRFTKDNYFSSLQFWKQQNDSRWNFTRSCVPFGKRTNETVLLWHPEVKTITEQDEFTFTSDKILPKNRTNERYYFKVELDKQITGPSLEIGNVLLVVDAYNSAGNKRSYTAVELFNDRFEGQNDWKSLTFEGQIYDYLSEYDTIRVYIWNQGKKRLLLRNIRIAIEEYKS